MVRDAGYSSVVLEIGSNHPTPSSDNASPSPLAQTRLGPFANQSMSSPMTRNLSENSWEKQQIRQNKAWEILGRAKMQPLWVDPDTGENPLHALARLKHADILHYIQKFISKEVDLNLQSHDRCSPLTAFVRDRPWQGVEDDETGAILAKYLDALLWKDVHHVHHMINVNLKDENGATALYHAAIRGRPDSVRSLIYAGANVNATIGMSL